MKAPSRIFWRGGPEKRPDGTVAHRAKRAYGDFRDFGDVGGGREPLKAPGTTHATDDPAVAETLLTARLAELKRLRRDRAMIGESKAGATLAAVAKQHLILKAQAGKQSRRWLVCAELHLVRACEFFGASRRLTTIGVEDIHGWIARLETMKSKRNGRLAPGSVRHHLNSLSSLFRRAQSLGLVPSGTNPVAAMMPGERPAGKRKEAAWLEVHEAAWLLEVARRTPAHANGCPFLYPLLATFLLTGGRKAEVLGLEVDDVSFDRQTLTFRPNRWRRLKNDKSHRTIRLWPQLSGILRTHIFPLDRTPREGLLFPAVGTAGATVMASNFDKGLDAVAERAGWKPGEIRSRIFRNTFVAARLQTLDGGAPISPFTVAREVGHADLEMLSAIYGHAGVVRHRSDVVEFLVEQHRDQVRERFGSVVTTLLTPQRETAEQEIS